MKALGVQLGLKRVILGLFSAIYKYFKRTFVEKRQKISLSIFIVSVGFISDLVIGGEDEADFESRDATRDFWSDFVDTNYSDLFTAFNITSKSDQDVFKELVSSAVARPKRQANFPGTTRKENKNL